MFCILQLYLRLYFTYLAHDIVRIITGFRFSHTFYVSLYTRKKTAVTLIIIIVQICFLVYNNFTLRFLVYNEQCGQDYRILYSEQCTVTSQLDFANTRVLSTHDFAIPYKTFVVYMTLCPFKAQFCYHIIIDCWYFLFFYYRDQYRRSIYLLFVNAQNHDSIQRVHIIIIRMTSFRRANHHTI